MEELYDAAEDDWDDDEDEATQYMIEQSLQEYSKHTDSATRYIFMMLTTCVMSGNEDALKVLVQRKEALSNADSRGWIHLHEAAVQHKRSILEITYAGPRDKYTVVYGRETPLFLAIVHGLRENATFLLQNGCDPDCKNEDDDSALVAGVEGSGSYDVAKKNIILCIWCNEMCLCGLRFKKHIIFHILYIIVSPLCPAFIFNNPLMLRGQCVVQVSVSWFSLSFIFDAAASGNPDIISLLLEYGADPNVPTHTGHLPIHRASYLGHLLALEQLIPVTKKEVIKESGMSLLHSAAAGDHSQCLDLLLSSGFDPNLMLHPRVRRNYEDECRSALFFVVSNNDAGAMPNQDPVNCLQVAMRLGNYELINTLLRYGANVNYYSRVNTTHFPSALQYALKDEVMLRMLLNNGYDVQRCFDCPYGQASHMPMDYEGWSAAVIKDVVFCEVITVYWLKHISAQVVRIVLDYVDHVSLCSKLKSVLTEQKQWLEICKIQENAQSLKHLCRLKIRDCLGRLCLRAPVFISFLPLPVSLKDYIHVRICDLYNEGLC
uniref:Ankyrin repeat and SOCS box containing 14b n=1 Tax=Sinocyclocheilus rhinocerous TaxID=307959 RepID=A0A673M2Z9_9TELE